MEPCKHMSIPGSDSCEDCLLSMDGELRRKPMDTISRRDYLAGMAMQGLINNDFIKKYVLMDSQWKKKNEDGTDVNEANALAIESIFLADALIARLDGEGKN